MVLKCSVIQKNLSAFLDNQLDTDKYIQIENHLSGCSDCLHRKEELQEIIGRVERIAIPKVTPLQWEQTHNRLISSIENLPTKKRLLGFPALPKWTLAPVGAFAVALLIFITVFVIPSGNRISNPISVDICLQEHFTLYSKQIFPTGIMPEFAIIETDQVTQQELISDKETSDLDTLMEAHYGIN
jgi:hypothetical protein